VAPGLVALAWFWVALLVIAGAGAATLQVLGPPAAVVARAGAGRDTGAKVGKLAAAPPAAASSAGLARPTATSAAAMKPVLRKPGVTAPTATQAAAGVAVPAPAKAVAEKPDSPGPAPGPAIRAVLRTDPAIPPPDAALLAADPGAPGVMLPRIGADGLQPMQAYAAVPPPADGRPMVAMVVSGLGLAAADSEVAIDKLPAAVDLAFSPYAVAPDDLLAQARAHGHEILVSIPMEPQGYPLNDPGNHALLVANSPAQNLAALDWALARIPGAVGAIGALDGMRGERLAATPTAFDAMQRALAGRGLLYLDPRPGAPAPVLASGRSVDVVVDEPPDPAAIDAALARLEARARAHGSALGLAGPLRPATLRHLIAWATGLGARGLLLVPASAIAGRPAGVAAE
jgi:hypothetical protein